MTCRDAPASAASREEGAVSGVVRGLVAMAVVLASASVTGAQSFTYFGDSGPAHWGELSSSWATCSAGTAQSPVDFGALALAATKHRELTLHYGETRGTIFNNGQTVEVETEGENDLEVDGQIYRLVQFHFHNPSEHRFAGRGADMELHLVHRSTTGALAVVGVLLNRGGSTGALSVVFDHLPRVVGEEEVLAQAFDPLAFLPSSPAHYRYAGSLTTPPCSEGVRWMVLATPVTVSDEHMARFAAQVSFNARPVQRKSR
jgi:carbonic anhydrase